MNQQQKQNWQALEALIRNPAKRRAVRASMGRLMREVAGTAPFEESFGLPSANPAAKMLNRQTLKDHGWDYGLVLERIKDLLQEPTGK
jgi:hypothetical protein